MYFMLIDTVATHLVTFLVSFVHPTLSRYQNQTSTFVLVSINIIQSGVNSRHMALVTFECEDEHFVCTSC